VKREKFVSGAARSEAVKIKRCIDAKRLG